MVNLFFFFGGLYFDALGGGRILTHCAFLLYTQKNYELPENFHFFLTVQKPGHESSVFVERNEEIKLTTIISTSF